jgi:hypothetical protein
MDQVGMETRANIHVAGIPQYRCRTRDVDAMSQSRLVCDIWKQRY